MKNLFEDGETAQQMPAKQNQSIKKPSGVKLDLLKKIIKADYVTFIKRLGDNINDPKFVEAIEYLAQLDRVDLVNMNLPVKSLIPTQNEIDIKKSLDFPLKSGQSMAAYLSGGPVAPNGPIITSGGGKYIIDGHHRWSQVYVCNPNCAIQAIDMSDIKGPFAALKSAQLGIAAVTRSIPSQTAEPGFNMLTMPENKIKDYVLKYMFPDVLKVLFDHKIIQSVDNNGKLQAAEYLWQNAKAMQQYNLPIQGAPERSLMPQTDTAKSTWNMDAPNPETTVTEQIARLQFLANIRK